MNCDHCPTATGGRHWEGERLILARMVTEDERLYGHSQEKKKEKKRRMEWITATISSLVPSTHRTHNDERESNFFLFPVYSRRIQ